MLKLACPACGAEVAFRSKASVFAVCSFCKSTLVRHDMNLENIGKMADLQDDLTPLQIGTSGTYNNESFEIIGRLKVGYSEGFWNEWYILFGGDKVGWLAEAQGFYAVCFPVSEETAKVPSSYIVKPEMFIQLTPDDMFQVEDIRNVSCMFSEGELPVNAVKGRESVSVDLTAPKTRMATIEYANDQTRIFIGDYQEFDDFKFKNLRQIDGW